MSFLPSHSLIPGPAKESVARLDHRQHQTTHEDAQRSEVDKYLSLLIVAMHRTSNGKLANTTELLNQQQSE